MSRRFLLINSVNLIFTSLNAARYRIRCFSCNTRPRIVKLYVYLMRLDTKLFSQSGILSTVHVESKRFSFFNLI